MGDTRIGDRRTTLRHDLPISILGVLWIVNGVIVLLGSSTRYERAIAISIVALFYALPGTLIGLVTIVLSLRERSQVRDSDN